MDAINIEARVFAWASEADLKLPPMLLALLDGKSGSSAIVPMAGITRIGSYTDGTKLMAYEFAYRLAIQLSASFDDANAEAYEIMRSWQTWIMAQEAAKNYPDLGAHCSNYKLELLSDTPIIMGIDESGIAGFQSAAKLTYNDTSEVLFF